MTSPLDSAVARLPQTVVAYDIESSGTSTHYDQIFQLSALRTDRSFADPRDPACELDLRARRQPWVVPSPKALLVTRMSPKAISEGLSHHEFIAQVEHFFRASGSIYLTFNGLRFDEEMLRHALYRAVRPPYLTQRPGSTRADLLVMARAMAIIDPSALNVPVDAAGRATFRLGALARANGVDFPADTAHDALADVRATLALARCVKERASSLFDQALALADKHYAASVLRPGNLIFQPLFVRGAPSARALGVIAPAEDDSNAIHCVDLADQPAEYLGRSLDDLRVWIARSPSPIVTLRANAQPMVFVADGSAIASRLHDLVRASGNGWDLTLELLQERAAKIAEGDFVDRIYSVLADQKAGQKMPSHVDAQLYAGGFPSEVDIINHRRVVRHAFPHDRPELAGQLRDPRLRELALRICYEEDPAALDPATRARIESWRRDRLLGPVGSPWRTIAEARAEMDILTVCPEPGEEPLLREIAAWLDEIEADVHATASESLL